MWLRDGSWQQRVVDRGTICDARTIVELSSLGLPVTSNNARTLVQFLAEYEALNLPRLPATHVASKMGWQGEDGSDGFLWGRHLITANGIILNDEGALVGSVEKGRVRFRGADIGDDQLAGGFYAAGTHDGWITAITPLTDYPRARLALYTSFVPPLLMILRSANFGLDFAGQTTIGKTTALRVAALASGATRQAHFESSWM